MRDFMGRNFVWFVGVVEDRNDPIEMGRVRVRAFGWHTEDKDKIPTDALPWAMVTNGIQSGSVSGLGFSPTGIVEGSWVVGFFMDGERAQEPVVLGTMIGAPTDYADTSTGFNDPTGRYPKWIGDTDVSLAARGECEFHPSRILKDNNRINDSGDEISYPTARPPKITSVAPDRAASYYAYKTWQEKPAADGIISEYPHNHVFQTEGGHLQEFDDTDGGIRYHRFHPTGTYEEIVNDGTRTVKVIGDDYEILLKDKNVYIKGDLNLTVEGNKRELIKGNYHLEVVGDVSYDFKSSWQRKVNHNLETEVGRDRATNINGDDALTMVTGDSTENVIAGQKILNVQQDYTITTNEDYFMTAAGNTQFVTIGNYNTFTNGNCKHTIVKDITVQTKGNMQETIEGSQTTDVTGNVDINAARIDLN